MFANIILIVLILSIVLTPLVETFLLGREKLTLSATIYNSFRAARQASYSYIDMRRIDAIVDEEIFKRTFAETFAKTYDMDCVDENANPLRFKSYDDVYNDFEITLDFNEKSMPGDGDSTFTEVNIRVETEYNFKTKYLQEIDILSADPYLLADERTFNMQVVN
jgi:hypothetical protein